MAASIAPFTNLHRSHSATILADPPWQFANKTGKVAPEHRRLHRYQTMTLDEIMALPVEQLAAPTAHLYLWCPNALLPDGLAVMKAWGFSYKTNIVWHKIRKDGGSDGRGVGFYFRNVTELLLFGTRGRNARTLGPGRRQVNFLETRKREHSRKPDEQYEIVEACSSAPYLELFARSTRENWTSWGDEVDQTAAPLAHDNAPIIHQHEQSIAPTELKLPPIEQRIYEIVQRCPNISAEEMRRRVWANDPNSGSEDEDRKVLHIHVAQLNQLLAAHGVMVRSEAGQYCIRSTTP